MVILAIAPYIEYIKIWIENFHLHLLFVRPRYRE